MTKQRTHHSTGKTNPFDIYPEIDQYIPKAVAVADKVTANRPGKWSKVFHQTMDKMLKKDGLRF